MNFAYHNSWLIHDLRKRGDHIKYQNWNKLNKLNVSITKKIHEKMDELICPKCAFVSIESEEAYNYLAEVETEDKNGCM